MTKSSTWDNNLATLSNRSKNSGQIQAFYFVKFSETGFKLSISLNFRKQELNRLLRSFWVSGIDFHLIVSNFPEEDYYNEDCRVPSRNFSFPILIIMKSSYLMFSQFEHAQHKRYVEMLAGS